MGWGWLAYRYLRRGRRSRSLRRSPYLHLASLGLIALLGTQKEKSRRGVKKPPQAPATVPNDPVPPRFQRHESWAWDEGDREYFRYATDLWVAHTFSHWGVIAFPAGSDGAWIFFEIAQQQQADNRGTAAKGAGRDGAFSASFPVLLVFRLRDGYQQFFAAVQTWSHVDAAIFQDTPLLESNKWPQVNL
jgi:hypothetical protein